MYSWPLHALPVCLQPACRCLPTFKASLVHTNLTLPPIKKIKHEPKVVGMMMDQKNQLGPEQKKKLDSTELSGPKKHGAARGVASAAIQ